MSTAYKTVLYSVAIDLCGQNVLQLVAIDSAAYQLTISSPDIDNIGMSFYDIKTHEVIQTGHWLCRAACAR